MKAYSTLVEVIQSCNMLSGVGVNFIRGAQEEKFISYQELYMRSLRLLDSLQKQGVCIGDEVVFQIDDEEEFIYAFWACVLGGFIPVPCTVGSNDEHRLKLFKIWGKLQRPRLLTNQSVVDKLEDTMNSPSVISNLKSRTILVEDVQSSIQTNSAPFGKVYKAQSNDIAFIQFSSGSTGDPKGVIVTHENLMCNLKAIIKGLNITVDDSLLSWMPLTHDMGLIAMHLMPFYAKIQQNIMPTSLFVRRSNLWMGKVSEHKITVTASPNFGYKLFLTMFKPKYGEKWDLSSVKIILNGAEPISYDLCDQFLDFMHRYKLNRKVMLPVYGLAEATVGATIPTVGKGMDPVYIDRRSLQIGKKVEFLSKNESTNADCVTFLYVGSPINDLSVRICNEKNEVLNDCEIGFIQICGKCVTRGYYNDSLATTKVFTKDEWLNTGDLGFLHNGHLVITGRAKDIIFINGQNVYPHDIERVAEAIQGVNLGKVAAVGIYNEETENDEVILFIQFKKRLESFIDMFINIKKYINRKMGISIKHVIPVSSIPKTTSGKVQRYKLGERFKKGEFNEIISELNFRIGTCREEEQIVLPRNEVEESIVSIWKRILNVKSVSVYDNFFEVGGTSILLGEMVEQVNLLYPGIMKISDPFALPTIEKITEYILNSQRQLSLKSIQFPSEYFEENGFRKRFKELTLSIGREQCRIVESIIEGEQINISDVLLALWIHLLSQITSNTDISMQVLSDRNTVSVIDVRVSEFSELLDLAKALKLECSLDEKKYRISDLEHIKVEKKGMKITPFFYDAKLISKNIDWLQYYDLVLKITELDEEINITCGFNNYSLNGEKIEDLLEIYKEMLQMLN
ncbi:non-ribosomal peptide synthetase [Bacillus cereus group sp. N34]|uniref:non-ribosomal peptide synthetase n=1 Tax=Bacillus cereus group sp. N34 TaxID=2794595 RepID=UPI0018F5A508|nr:non-ribosomal peptide synthetase [Bacillus cereus group sp. N34]MBJ8015075.1 non-ribosomal peptide synthetase [Bacillus cereus group sp. N34]